MIAVMKAAKRKRSQPITWAKIRALKAQDRQRDWDRLARGEVTPRQLQKENAAVKHAAEFQILNLKEVTRQYRAMNRRRAAC